MHKRVPDTPFWQTGGFGDFFPQVEKNKNSEIKIKLRKCIKECLTPLFIPFFLRWRLTPFFLYAFHLRRGGTSKKRWNELVELLC